MREVPQFTPEIALISPSDREPTDRLDYLAHAGSWSLRDPGPRCRRHMDI